MFFGALGVIILPDLFQRFHASTKCAVSGAFSVLLGLSFYSKEWQYIGKFLVIMVFFILVSPLVAHMLAVSTMQEESDGGSDESNQYK